MMRDGVYLFHWVSWVIWISLSAGMAGLAYGANGGGGGISNSPTPAQSAATTSSLVPWSDESVYQQCGQSCLLTKANETLTMQALYIGYRLKDVRQMWDDALSGSVSGSATYDSIMAEIHSYCPDKPAKGASETETKACLQSYFLAQIPILRSIKTAIAQNLTNTLSYRADIVSVAPDGTIQRRPVSAYQVAVQPIAKVPQTTYVPSLHDLRAERAFLRAQNQQQNYFATATYDQWYRQSRPVQPNRSDFILWKTVPIDPNDPSQGTVSVPQMENGHIKYDPAFKSAQKEYQKQLARFKSLATGKTANSPSPVNEAPTKNAADDYRQAYEDYVQQNNAYVLSQGVAVMSVGPRSPAAVAAPGMDSTQVKSDQKGVMSGETPVQPAPMLNLTELSKSFTPDEVDDLIGAQTDFLTKALGYKPPKN